MTHAAATAGLTLLSIHLWQQLDAEILNEPQLRVFVRMQDDLLARERLEARTTTLVERGI